VVLCDVLACQGGGVGKRIYNVISLESYLKCPVLGNRKLPMDLEFAAALAALAQNLYEHMEEETPPNLATIGLLAALVHAATEEE
jgi:hypothetical protein